MRRRDAHDHTIAIVPRTAGERAGRERERVSEGETALIFTFIRSLRSRQSIPGYIVLNVCNRLRESIRRSISIARYSAGGRHSLVGNHSSRILRCTRRKGAIRLFGDAAVAVVAQVTRTHEERVSAVPSKIPFAAARSIGNRYARPEYYRCVRVLNRSDLPGSAGPLSIREDDNGRQTAGRSMETLCPRHESIQPPRVCACDERLIGQLHIGK